ncbi:ActS/PrrB/RegB family redox-sensitive histidine kinase [Pseudaquidulcibacter saccharophilus]|uniref:ActS/PrrB/RegB family redox-sensitive histidine kinase n=1 Tax=Pseudaquidulcibacter saccharophilus TaxID=2831900 RepID=UPI001EFF39C0|nr:ActS/PrrB/RegB family redox-sensitive histidine kinase [Pseudaquidulcibacter saccharophilus]
MANSEAIKAENNLKTTRMEFSGRLRLRTLVALRWLAIIGQSIAIIVVGFLFHFPLPLAWCFGAVAVSSWINIILAFALPSQRLLKSWEATTQLSFDLLQLTFLLYLTGGITNPFSVLVIAPATIAAATLRPRWVLFIVVLAMACVTFLHYNAMPLPWYQSYGIELPQLYKSGLAIGIIIGLLFTTAYAFRVSAEEMRLADALIATQKILAKEQQLAAVGGLAAAAAHELGTPLATIQLTSKEMVRDLKSGQSQEDAQLIYEQSLRCRDILRNLSLQKYITDPTVEKLPIGQLLQEAAGRHSQIDKAVLFDINPPSEDAVLIVHRMPEVLYGLGNFIENGLQYAKEKLIIRCMWNNRVIEVEIVDDGRGFDPDILPRLGEPYVTTRGHGSSGAQIREGMGLGFFIAKTLLERSGGHVRFGNQASPKSGAIVRVVWSRDDLEYKE